MGKALETRSKSRMLIPIGDIIMMKKHGLFLASLLVLLVGCTPPGLAPEKESAVTLGEVAGAEFSIPNLANPSEKLSLAPYKGQVVLLDFWATWCPPCRSELPALNRLYNDLKEKGFVIVGMTVDNGSVEQVAEAVKRFELSYPVGLAGEDVQQAYGGIRAVPTKFLLDKKGAVAKQYTGVVPERQLRADVEALLAL
jgi:thiol-disulfide isomerase/thioredoxin